MARYTLGKDVWEIEQVGSELHITAKGKQSVRKFVTPEQATAQLAKLVAAQEAAGYRTTVAERRHPELERMIAAAPEEPTGYAVYADWLESQGDPRGKLIALQLASETDDKLDAAATKLIAAHVDQLLGPLAKHRKNARKSDEELFTFRYGFIHRANVSGIDHANVDLLLGQLLQHPSARFLVDLRVMAPWEDVQPVIDALVANVPATLRELKLTQPRSRVDLGPLWPRIPHLRKLVLRGTGLLLGAFALPALEHLEIEDDKLTPDTMHMLARAPWPVLDRFVLSRAWDVTTELVELLGRGDLVLRHLSLTSLRCGDDLARALVASPVANRLVTLDLSLSGLTDEGARVLARGRDKLPCLQQLVAESNALSREGIEALAQVAASTALT